MGHLQHITVLRESLRSLATLTSTFVSTLFDEGAIRIEVEAEAESIFSRDVFYFGVDLVGERVFAKKNIREILRYDGLDFNFQCQYEIINCLYMPLIIELDKAFLIVMAREKFQELAKGIVLTLDVPLCPASGPHFRTVRKTSIKAVDCNGNPTVLMNKYAKGRTFEPHKSPVSLGLEIAYLGKEEAEIKEAIMDVARENILSRIGFEGFQDEKSRQNRMLNNLKLLADAHVTREIAKRLNVSAATISKDNQEIISLLEESLGYRFSSAYAAAKHLEDMGLI